MVKKTTQKPVEKCVKGISEKKQTPCCSSVTEVMMSKAKETKTKTKIIARFDCGFPNSLFIRGEGISTLSWEKGLAMKNISPNEWMWESDRPCSTVQFKVLVNDAAYEQGENHTVAFGQALEFCPKF